KADAALLPRPYGVWAEERGFKRITDWTDIVDDPLPISIETTPTLLRERGEHFSRFLQAHRAGIRYMNAHRVGTIPLLAERLGHPGSMTVKIWDTYLVWMDERLTVDFKQFERLLAQVARGASNQARQVATEWIMPGGLRD